MNNHLLAHFIFVLILSRLCALRCYTWLRPHWKQLNSFSFKYVPKRYYAWVVCLRVDLSYITRGRKRVRWERRGELERDGVVITCIISQGQACESDCRWFHYKKFSSQGVWKWDYSTVLASYALLICIYVLQYVEYGFSFLPAENIPMEAPPPLFVLERLWWSLVYKFYQL